MIKVSFPIKYRKTLMINNKLDSANDKLDISAESLSKDISVESSKDISAESPTTDISADDKLDSANDKLDISAESSKDISAESPTTDIIADDKLYIKSTDKLDRMYVYKNNCIIPFYNKREFEAFDLSLIPQVKIKYIKGLGTNESDDVIHYFKNYFDNKLTILFDKHSEEKIDMVFNSKRADDRKSWMETIGEETYLPRAKGTPIKCEDFINNDLVTFSYDNCTRSIPSCIDGLKPTQRKILYTLMKEPKNKELKVTELGGYVTKETNYHHGNVSVEETIIKMAQNYVGSNNIPLLNAIGEFGTRYKNGEDAASARYLHTSLSSVARCIFPIEDDPVLERIFEEGKYIEPRVYVPIIPMILVNGAEGIGTGWSTSIPCFKVKDIVNITKRYLNGETIDPDTEIKSHYQGFKGSIKFVKDKWIYTGIYTIKGNELIINELPVGKRALSIYEIREKLKDLQRQNIVEKWSSVDKLNPDFKIKFITPLSENAIVSMFNLETSTKNTNMVAFNSEGKINKYKSLSEIFNDWYKVRHKIYALRIDYILDNLRIKQLELMNKIKFIKEIVNKTLIINDRKRLEIECDLDTKCYDLIDGKYDYLLSMRIYSLTKEKIIELEDKNKEITDEIKYYEKVSVENLWLKDLGLLMDL